MKVLQSLVLVAIAIAGVDVRAAPVAVANLAPDTIAGGITIEIDGIPAAAALGYKSFASIELDTNAHRIGFRRAADSSLLVEQVFGVDARAGLSPTLALIGNGQAQPHEVLRLVAPPAPNESNPNIDAGLSFVHAAPFASADQAINAIEFRETCQYTTAIGTIAEDARGGGSLTYRQFSLDDVSSRNLPETCALDLSGFPFGNLRIENLQLQAQRTLRAYLVGDGTNAPYELIAAVGADVVGAIVVSTQTFLPQLKSTTIWFDQDHPVEGVAIYEIGLSGNVAITWFTFGPDTKPIWYFLDGVPATVPGWRDLVVYRVDRSGGTQHTTAVGNARMIYQDCNNANLRILLGSDDFHSLRLSRTVPVQRCAGLN